MASTPDKYPPPCRYCGCVLHDDFEIDMGCCGPCADKLYEKSQERADFDYWHPSEDTPS